jgi:HEPN domain-containing protein
MSDKKNRYEAERWLKTAEDDISAAKVLLDNGKYAQACFFSQQAAEKAVKSFYYLKDIDPWGHSVKKLITDISEHDPACYEEIKELEPKAMILDRFYIPTRYPNGLPNILPSQAYCQADAKTAIEGAKEILRGIKIFFAED